MFGFAKGVRWLRLCRLMLLLVAEDTSKDGIEAFGKCPSFEGDMSFYRVKDGLQVVIMLDFKWVTMSFGHAC